MTYSPVAIAAIQARLDAYLAAELAILKNQSYELEGRKLTRASLATVRQGIAELRSELATAQGAPLRRGRARRGVSL